MVRRGNSVGLQCFKPDRDEVLHAIESDHHNVIYMDPDIKFAPGIVDDTIISASTGMPTWEPVAESCDPIFWSDADPDYVALAQ
eukprot:5172511-Ditylum_brightwellii.AAC.1